MRRVMAAALLLWQAAPSAAQADNGSLTLRQAIETALKQSPRVQASRAEADAARHEAGAARAMASPQVSAHTTLAASSMPGVVASSPGVVPPATLLVPDRPWADQSVALMAPVYTGGRLRALTRGAEARARSAGSGVAEEQAAAALAVREAYYRALLAEEIRAVAAARLEAADAMVRNAQARVEAGKGIEAGVQRARAELAAAQRDAAAARNERASALVDLEAVMGVPLRPEVTLADALPPVAEPPPAAALEQDARRARPELQAARARVEAAAAMVEAARGASAPQVYAGVMADVFTPSAMGRSAGLMAALTVSVPLFDAGQRRSETAAAFAMQRRAEAELRGLELEVTADVRKARLDVQTAAESARSAEAAVTAAGAAYDVMVERVAGGKSVMVEQLDALAALVAARAARARALYDGAVASARLLRAVGRVDQ